MRTSRRPVSSPQRLSSWLMAALGLAAYVGLVYALTLVPIQLEIPLPDWSIAIIPPLTYGLLVWLWVGRPSVVRWLVGTALLSGLHLLLGMAREPLTALLDPALSGRALPWDLPPPLPEIIGVILLLVPLSDVLHAPVRLARERGAGAGRPSPSHRARPATAARVQPAVAVEGTGSLSETLLARHEPAPEPAVTAVTAPAPAPPPPAAPTGDAELQRRAATLRAGRRRAPEADRPRRRSDVVLRIALDRIMGQLPPGTFLAPEDEVAASLSEPGYVKVSGELIVTQLADGVARVAWADIADQFPRHLIGLSTAEISEHLGEGLRLPLDEVIGQLPHELFVADTPELVMPGLDRIPVPFHPVEESVPVPAPEAAADPVGQPTMAVAPPPEPALDVPRPGPVLREPVPRPEPARAEVAAGVADVEEPTVRISFDRVAPEMPEGVFRVPLTEVSARLRHPGALLVPQSVVLPQLAEGLIRVSWDVVAAQFARDDMAIADAEVAARLPDGIRLPLDEVVRQVPQDLFMAAGPAADVRGLESFPAPFQPLLSDPAPAAPPPSLPVPAEPAIDPEPVPLPAPPAVRAPEPIHVAEPPSTMPAVASAEPSPATVELPPTVPVVERAEPIHSALELPASAHVPLEEPREAIPAVTGAIPIVEAPAWPEPGVVAEPVAERVPGPAAGAEVVSEIEGMVEPVSPQAEQSGLVMAAPEPEPSAPTPAGPPAHEPSPGPAAPRWAEPAPIDAMPRWPDRVSPAPSAAAPAVGPAEAAEARRIVALLAPIASFDVSVQMVDGVTVFAMASPTVAQETTVAAAGLALPLLMDRRLPGPVEQLTLRGPETALVLTPLGGSREGGPVLAAAAGRGGGLALLEILCRRAAAERARPTAAPRLDAVPAVGHGLAQAPVPSRAAALPAGLTAFGDVSVSVLRNADSEAVFYFFLPAGGDVPAVGAFAQDLEAVMRKAAGSGAVFRTAILRSRDTLLVIQPEEIGHGRSIVIVAGGPVTRPGLAYRQVERAAATLMSA